MFIEHSHIDTGSSIKTFVVNSIFQTDAENRHQLLLDVQNCGRKNLKYFQINFLDGD